MAVTRSPRVFKSNPVEEAMTPFPMPLMTPPETRTYFIVAVCLLYERGIRLDEGGASVCLCAKIYDRVLVQEKLHR